MKPRFILFKRAGVYYSEDTTTHQQISLRTKDEGEALTLLHSKNEAFRQPVLNLQIARTYMAASDPEVAKRTWQVPMDEMTKTKTGSTLASCQRAMQDKAFDLIRDMPILETHSGHFLKVLEAGGVATNVFLRRIHNFVLDMNWLPWPILAKKQWPAVRFQEKRAITWKEHQAIVERERYQCKIFHESPVALDVGDAVLRDIDAVFYVHGSGDIDLFHILGHPCDLNTLPA
jgi:hypothetical protein